MRKVSLRALLFSLALALSGGITAPAGAAYSDLYVFGDSLSDPGNLAGTRDAPPPPYVGARSSNGPVAAEYLAGLLHIPSGQFADYAVAGATTGAANPDASSASGSGVRNQVRDYLSSQKSTAPNALYMIWAGSDDLLNLRNPQAAGPAITRAVANIVSEVAALEAAGARHFLVPGIPDLGLAPRVTAQGPTVAAQATFLSASFNQALAQGLAAISGVTGFNTFQALDNAVANPGAFGFTNVTTPCFDGTQVCADPAHYLFWDDLHPTTATHFLLAEQFAAALAGTAPPDGPQGVPPPVPEPPIALLLGVGLLAWGGMRRSWPAQEWMSPST